MAKPKEPPAPIVAPAPLALADLQRDPIELVDPRSLPWRHSRLKLIAKSPAHYLHACQTDVRETLSMRLGSGCHAILFEQPFVVFGGKTRSGGAWEAFEAEHAGKTILNRREYAEALAMADAIRRNPQAVELLLAADAVVEQQISWTLAGRACTSTPDARRSGIIVDLKSTRCAEPSKFLRDVVSMAYHSQLSFYDEACDAVGIGRADEQFIIAVENKAPYVTQVFRMSAELLDMGRRCWGAWAEQLRVCEESDHWPGYALGEVLLEPAADDDHGLEGLVDDELDEAA